MLKSAPNALVKNFTKRTMFNLKLIPLITLSLLFTHLALGAQHPTALATDTPSTPPTLGADWSLAATLTETLHTTYLPAIYTVSRNVRFEGITLEPVTAVVSGLPDWNGPALITSLRHAGDGRLFVTERDGYIHIIHNGAPLPQPFLDISHLVAIDLDFVASEQGLLSLAFHPNYAQNGYFFVSYVEDEGDFGRSVIARYQVSDDNPNQADPDSFLRILTVPQPTKSHNGGDIHFGPDGYLYFALGDGTRTDFPDPNNNSQNPRTLLGKMIRIDINHVDPNSIDCGDRNIDHYSIPADNPFVQNAGVCNEIWASGLRNPWRFSFDRQTGDLYIADVGMHMREELNFAPAGDTGGQNYGWRCYEGNWPLFTDSCTPETISQLTPPVLDFDHATQSVCSITGGYVYRGSRYPEMAGHYLMADFCYGSLWSVIRTPAWEATVRYAPQEQNFSTFGEGADGELYVADYFKGRIFHIQPILVEE